MVSPDQLFPFVAAAIFVLVTPGPSVLFVVSRAMAYGRLAAFATVLGGAAGAFVLAAGVAVGLGAIVSSSSVGYLVIKILGAVYLVYLGVRAVLDRRDLCAAVNATASATGRRRTWGQGFVVGLTNPKSIVFFAAMLPQFVDEAAGSASVQMMILGATFTVLTVLVHSVWAFAAGTVREWFASSNRRLEFFGAASGLTMIGLGVGAAFSV